MEPHTLAALAISHKQLLPSIQQYCFNERMVRTFQRGPGFNELQYRSHQICFVSSFAWDKVDRELSIAQLARAFGCHANRVKVALANGLEESKKCSGHPAFDEDSEDEILAWIEAQAEKYRPMIRTDLRHYCEVKYSRPVSRGWIDSFVLRHAEDLIETKSSSQEETRLKVLRALLDEMIRCLREYVRGMKAELVFNLDEVGISDWEDQKDKKVIDLKTMNGQTIHHHASRNVRYISIITCITAAEESLMPYIMTLQDSELLCRRLMRHGVRLGVDFILQKRSKPYVNATLFLNYIDRIFILYFTDLRVTEKIEACEAVLLMDNCSYYVSDDVIELLSRAQVKIIIFATHTTHIFQMLDVVLFEALKKHATGLRTLDEEQPAAAFIIKVYYDFKQTMVETNIWRTFAAVWFTHDIEQSPYGLLFDEQKFQQSPGFRKLWDCKVPLGSLSRRWRKARFGWINKLE
jgi:hypothetical protein